MPSTFLEVDANSERVARLASDKRSRLRTRRTPRPIPARLDAGLFAESRDLLLGTIEIRLQPDSRIDVVRGPTARVGARELGEGDHVQDERFVRNTFLRQLQNSR